MKSVEDCYKKVKSNCFIIDKKLAYITDVSDIYRKDFSHFKNLKYLIIDCLWYNYHPSHFNLEKSLYNQLIMAAIKEDSSELGQNTIYRENYIFII